ncbi:hypothetical protein [Mangrovihabitans endophyticus]|uniref:hypothetical protein n=1 Tax=Mangrovihabitans endophyticus TaxID=1751298 RepID=UPI00166626C0|nr:hypothetical protein [Mangrovihabitans endophyticus]
MESGWAWATQSRYPGFCLSFIRDRDPATVAARLGGGPATTLTTYCYEERAPVGFLPSRIQQLSTGTELLQVEPFSTWHRARRLRAVDQRRHLSASPR